MDIFFIFIVIAWWIGMWGLSDLYTTDFTYEEKLIYYVALLGCVALFLTIFPNYLRRL
uniref:Uncharacterized protein n=1 Tax=viral metagenome TaxID=1070528 RepID=A0A6C0E812_9ZZZZ